MSQPPIIRAIDDSVETRVFSDIAILHLRLIHGGILSLLGVRFLAQLYREIASSRYGCIYAAIEEERLSGYIAGASDIWRCALGFGVCGWMRLASLFCMRIWREGVLRKALLSISYPFRGADASEAGRVPQSRHRAELLAIAVDESRQGHGLGARLVSAFEDFLRDRATEYSVTTNSEDSQSNAFYRRVGFTSIGQRLHHDLVLQVYTKQIAKTSSSKK